MKSSYRIEYLPIAEEDLLEIFDYICEDDPKAAARFIDRIDANVGKLADFPRLGNIPQDERLNTMGYRMLVIDNYLVFYVILDQTVEIRRVLHGSRRYSFLL